MKLLLVIIDSFRYDHSDLFDFKGFQKLTKVVSVSNWTMPVLTTLITGLHPLEHKVGVRPLNKDSNEVVFIRDAREGRIHTLEGWNLFRNYSNTESLILQEIPMFSMIQNGIGGPLMDSGKMEWVKEAEKSIEDGIEFLVLHLKGGHSPFDYAPDQKDSTSAEGYEKELKELSKHLVPFVEKHKDDFDKVAILADHGQLVAGKDPVFIQPHGREFALSNIHVPTWLYPNPEIKDELYDSRVAFEFLTGGPITSRQIVFSTGPSYGDYNKMAITYLVDGALFSENFETKKGYDL